MLIRIIDEIEKSIKNECFLAALALALTIPDICGKAEYPDACSTERYIKWYNTYIGKYEKLTGLCGEDMPYASGELVYNLRNTFLHQGTPSIEAQKIKEERCKVDKFVLRISDWSDGHTSKVGFSSDSMQEITERGLEINVIHLCNEMCLIAKKYFEENKQKFTFFCYEWRDDRDLYKRLFATDSKDKQLTDSTDDKG